MLSSIVVGGLSVSRRGLRGVGVAALMLGFGVCAASAGPIQAVTPIALAGGSGATSRVVAPGAIYSDVTNYTGYAYADGGASGPGNDDYTIMDADDLTLAGGGDVSGVNVILANFNNGTVTANVDLTFFANDGAGGLAGTVLGAFQVAGVTLPGAALSELNVSLSPGQLTLSQGTIWAGLAYDNANQANTSDAELNELGMGIFNPPDVGSSTDEFEEIDSSQAPYTSSDPSGGTYYFGGNPVANFGWELVAATPEPGCMGVMLFGLALMRRRARGA
jgi:hypothetical protein